MILTHWQNFSNIETNYFLISLMVLLLMLAGISYNYCLLYHAKSQLFQLLYEFSHLIMYHAKLFIFYFS